MKRKFIWPLVCKCTVNPAIQCVLILNYTNLLNGQNITDIIDPKIHKSFAYGNIYISYTLKKCRLNCKLVAQPCLSEKLRIITVSSTALFRPVFFYFSFYRPSRPNFFYFPPTHASKVLEFSYVFLFCLFYCCQVDYITPSDSTW